MPRNWRTLAFLVDQLRRHMGPGDMVTGKAFSISYGWIHPRLSEKIVRWKKPTDPSYHRWDDGAACDINFHGITYTPYHMNSELDNDVELQDALSPLGIASILNGSRDWAPILDRTITYSESPYICIGAAPTTRTGQGKWYENRFEGETGVKPRFITYKGGTHSRNRLPVRSLELDWRGQGWPSHHGKGVRQYQHIRTSYYSVMSDWLYDRDNVHFGVANRMPMSTTRYEVLKQAMHLAGRTYDVLQTIAPSHVSILEGLKIEKRTSNWEEQGHWSMTVTVPTNDGASFCDRVRQEFATDIGASALGIRSVETLPNRVYLTETGSRLRGMQYRVKVTGEMYGSGSEERFDFDSPARSPAFREVEETGGSGGDSGPEGVVGPRPRTRRRRHTSNSRRSVVTGTFD